MKAQSNHNGINSPKNRKGAGREDKDAELEILKNVKIFLTSSVKKNEEVISALQKDVEILKELLRVEKSTS